MKRTVQILEQISQWSGRVIMWFTLALVLLLTFEVFMRYVLNSPTIFSYEISTTFGVGIYAGGLAYCHLHGGHVRVDVFWKNLSAKGKAIADIVGAVLFFFPVTMLITYVSGAWVRFSISIHEIMTATYLYPPAWPVRSLMALGFFMIIPQGVAKLIRDIYVLKGIELKRIEEI